ncbi:MAG: polysaccharide pyruvyl transferase family protein [Mobilitalea sp.]
MKTATITYHDVYNYGAVLQAYALQQALLNLSIENVIIDYTPKQNYTYQKIPGRSLKIFIINIIRLMLTIKNYYSIKKRHKNFEKFIKKNLKLTRKYNTRNELLLDPPKADIYITGSDQLWNVSREVKRYFFLDFGNREIKRISYAVSMGSSVVPAHLQPQIRELLNEFTAISVRELETRQYLEELLEHRNFVLQHMDPVFLLNKETWSAFSRMKTLPYPYILCYPMSGHPLLSGAIKRLRELTGCKVVVLTSEITFLKGDVMIKSASVEEFVNLFQNAEYILTTSFHGTAFSAIFNKKFFSFLGNSAPGRITGLLTQLELQCRIINNLEEITTQEIDYNKTNLIIEENRQKAIEYLNSFKELTQVE